MIHDNDCDLNLKHTCYTEIARALTIGIFKSVSNIVI